MRIYRDGERIYFNDESLSRLASTNYSDNLYNIVTSTNWFIVKDKNGKPKYLKSSKSKKTLHQEVIDYYFGEDIRKKAYAQGMIIEHLDNDGFNCQIENLYFLLKIKNTYKGMHLDKLIVKSIPIAAMSLFHDFNKKEFQITLGFNAAFQNSEGRYIQNLRFLYKTSYEIVLQDAEQILEEIIRDNRFNIEYMKKKYRFEKYKIEYCPDIELTEEEKNLKAGNIIWRNGKPLILQGDTSRFRILSSGFDKDWE